MSAGVELRESQLGGQCDDSSERILIRVIAREIAYLAECLSKSDDLIDAATKFAVKRVTRLGKAFPVRRTLRIALELNQAVLLVVVVAQELETFDLVRNCVAEVHAPLLPERGQP